jgi:hypothetical protein
MTQYVFVNLSQDLGMSSIKAPTNTEEQEEQEYILRAIKADNKQDIIKPLTSLIKSLVINHSKNTE